MPPGDIALQRTTYIVPRLSRHSRALLWLAFVARRCTTRNGGIIADLTLRVFTFTVQILLKNSFIQIFALTIESIRTKII